MPKAQKKEAIVSKESHVAATFLIGRGVVKDFKGLGAFKGRVTDFHRDTGFRVEYEDGDTEDLTESALVSAHRPPPASASVHPPLRAHCVTVASMMATDEDYCQCRQLRPEAH